MFVKKLPDDVHSMLCASVKINNYKTAVEELIYNSLDAESTSIAIRIHIEENSIQVIDNGQGIKEVDMNVVGQRHMTSKFLSLSALKSVPNQYGLRGESLSDIIEVSQVVSITSRYKDMEETWIKTFDRGRSHKLNETTKRPSNGTTVSIKGFLYNRHIQRNTVNELNELQEIKTFLEQVSLLHSNISLSLRDDAKNCIILQLHKKRDIYQTLSNVFNIERSDVKELKVEKNKYKVEAYIGITSKDVKVDCIFLNRKLVHTGSRLHDIVNNNLNRDMKNRNKETKAKAKSSDFENCILNNNFAYYILFLGCPYFDYNMSHKSVEFKSWNQITMLLEKLIKFYNGNISVKEVEASKLKQNRNSRDQINEIMIRILNNNPEKLGGIQMQNGVNGKISKRKKRKRKKKDAKLSLSTTKKITTATVIADNEITKDQNILISPINLNESNMTNSSRVCKTVLNTECNKNKHKEVNLCNEKKKQNIEIDNNTSTKVNSYKRKVSKNQNKLAFFKDTIFGKFINPSDSIKQKCNVLAQRVQDMLESKKRVMGIKVQYENTRKKSRKDIYRKADESIINYSIHFTPNTKERRKRNRIILNDNLRRPQDTTNSYWPLKTTYDLIKTVMNENKSHNKRIKHYDEIVIKRTNKENTQIKSRATFESHRYDKRGIIKPKSMYYKNEQTSFIRNLRKFNYHMLDDSCEIKTLTPEIESTRYNNNIKKTGFTKELSLISNNEQISYSTDLYKNNQDTYTIYDFFKEAQNISKPNINSISSERNRIASKSNNIGKENLNFNEIIDDTMILSKYYKHREMVYNIEESITLINNSKVENKNTEEYLHEEVNYRKSTNENNFQFAEEKEFIIDPANVCETLLRSEDIFESQIVNSNLEFLQDDNVNISRYFTNNVNLKKTGDIDEVNNSIIRYDALDLNVDKIDRIIDPMHDNLNKNQLPDKNCNKNDISTDFRHFSLKNRLRFIPKGMSPIFRNCNTKYACDYYLDEDCYEKSLYNNFINEVHINSEIFNPLLQNINKLGSKGNERLQTKVHKDNTALKFDAKSLRDAIVVGQVDEKFIAAIIESKNNQDKDTLKFLVLFDQHAVHERIRTEENLSDYFKNNQWKSVKLEEINMILSVNEIIYLHNYKNKFNDMGLEFNILNSEEIAINAVPEAILGKSIRELDKVMKAVRNLIVEEINVIKTQGGCISMYPKSIMDLVFSEACRYAIKFGDKLTKNDCMKLIKDLSNCKTPFQCAHGRPVMAVVMDINSEEQDYKVNFTKLREFNSRHRL